MPIYNLAYEKIKTAKKILIAGHKNPDADALAAIGIIVEVALSLKKEVFVLAKNKDEGSLSFLPHVEMVSAELPVDFNYQSFDLLITLDCGSLSRTGLEEFITAPGDQPFIIEFDHHLAVDNYADLSIKQPELSSTTEILYNFLRANNLSLNKNIATCLLTGILDDTGNFLYPATTDNTVRIVSEALSAGASLPKIIRLSKQAKDLLTMKIWGVAIEKLKINERYQIAVAYLDKKTLLEISNAENLDELPSDVFGDIAGFFGNLSGVKASILLRDAESGEIKASLRSSNRKINLTRLARLYGGGGHAQASGFTFMGE